MSRADRIASNLRLPTSTVYTSADSNPTIVDQGSYYLDPTATITAITIGAPLAGTIMTIYNESGSSVTLNTGSSITSLRLSADNNDTDNDTMTLEDNTLTTIFVITSTMAVVSGTGSLV